MSDLDQMHPRTARYLASYRKLSRAHAPRDIQYPPQLPRVQDTIDLHCHADEGQQDALALAKYASQNGMGGILFKNIVGRQRPVESVRQVKDELHRWCEQEKLQPTKCWAGFNVTDSGTTPWLEMVRQQLDAGVRGIWMPVFASATTISKIRGIPWEDALEIGVYLLDDKGQLKPEVRDIIHLVADRGATLSFAHASHAELYAMAEEVGKIGFERAFVDHPFSPFVDLSVDEMKWFANEGIYLNFTFDEISPLRGVDPFEMYDAIRAIGVERVTLSSDAGEPLFPNSVESMRLMCTYMGAMGLSDEEVRRVSVDNPAAVMGLATAA